MNELRRFLLGEINVVDLGGGVIISKEIAPAAELWHISVDGEEKKMFWVSNNKEKEKPAKKGDYTGGKPPYIMVMESAVQKLIDSGDYVGDIYQQIGFLTAMSGRIEFKTGRLVHSRTKKPLTRVDLMGITKFTHNKIDKLLKNLRENNLLTHTADGYFISRKFIKKGAAR